MHEIGRAPFDPYAQAAPGRWHSDSRPGLGSIPGSQRGGTGSAGEAEELSKKRSPGRAPHDVSGWNRISVQVEVDVDDDLHGDGVALVHCRAELVLADCFDGSFIEPHAGAAHQVHVLRIALRVHDELNRDAALEVGLARLCREFRFNGVNDDRSADAAADAHDAAAVAAAAAWAGAN